MFGVILPIFFPSHVHLFTNHGAESLIHMAITCEAEVKESSASALISLISAPTPLHSHITTLVLQEYSRFAAAPVEDVWLFALLQQQQNENQSSLLAFNGNIFWMSETAQIEMQM